MNANEITFGIEIETHIPAGTLRVGPHAFGLPVPQLRNEWKADADPSIRCGAGRQKCEFVSPVFRGVDGLKQLIADVATIKSLGAAVNASCGIHIHVGFNRTDAAAMTKLATLVANFEKAIYASTGTKNRERGRWCRGYQRHTSAQAAIQEASRHRYHVCNLGSQRPTVEFRAFSASLNVQKIVAYVRMCVALVERAITAKRVTNFVAKPVVPTSPIARKGEGQTALNRLFYQLGWTKGRQDYTFGDLSATGIPSVRANKKTLMHLARKYDAQP